VAGYEILRKIGEGASGVVYRARGRDGRIVALKVLRQEARDDLEARARFWREGRAAAAVDHPNVARVLEVGSFEPDEGEAILYLVMELAGGRDLLQVMTFEDLSLPQVVDLGLAIAAGLGAAHRQGVVHRDLKPGNVRLSSTGAVKILDFGLAKLLRPPDDVESPVEEDLFTSHLGAVIGTAYYMAPEQVRGESVDARVDLFALGVLLYQAISGRLPFIGPSMREYLEAIESKEAPPLSQWRDDVPESFERVVHTLLEKDRDRRYSSAEEVIAALEAVRRELEGSAAREQSAACDEAEGEARGEAPPSRWARLRGLVRRRGRRA
jgi:serine/threonine-protein kinase